MSATFDIDELFQRIAALESKPITVGDLPMRKLQDRLERDWQPDGTVLFGTGLPRGGTAALTFTGPGLISATRTMAHGLGRVPVAIVATAYGAPAVDQVPVLNTFTWTDTTFDISGEIDAAYTGDISFSWVAL